MGARDRLLPKGLGSYRKGCFLVHNSSSGSVIFGTKVLNGQACTRETLKTPKCTCPLKSKHTYSQDFLMGVCWPCVRGRWRGESPHLGTMAVSDEDHLYFTKKKKNYKKAQKVGGTAQLVEHLPGMCQALGSNPRTTKEGINSVPHS